MDSRELTLNSHLLQKCLWQKKKVIIIIIIIAITIINLIIITRTKSVNLPGMFEFHLCPDHSLHQSGHPQVQHQIFPAQTVETTATYHRTPHFSQTKSGHCWLSDQKLKKFDLQNDGLLTCYFHDKLIPNHWNLLSSHFHDNFFVSLIYWHATFIINLFHVTEVN